MDKIDIAVDRVEQNDNINDCTCSICQNIFLKPVMCKNCENHFCFACIDEWIKDHPGACPFCKNFEKKKSSIILNNILDKLKVTCLFKDNGCKEVLCYDALLKHESKCVFNTRKETKYEKLLNNSIVLDTSVKNEVKASFLCSSSKLYNKN